MNRVRRWVPAVLVILFGSCGTGTDTIETRNSSAAGEGRGYCEYVRDAALILDEGGSEAEYNELLLRVIAESPSDQAETWLLMSKLSEEPFSYDNFNVAIDSLDRISEDLNSMCSGLNRMSVDDVGRMRLQPSG